jgi:YfiH family protein
MNRVENREPLQIIRIPGWERYPWLRHGFSTRSGGVSSVYGGNSLNLGWTKEDDPQSVAENRRRFIAVIASSATEEAAGDQPPTLVGVRQIHSSIVHAIRPEHGALEGKLATPEGKAVLEGDGLITALPGVMLGVGTADCVPVLIADVRKKVVAALHAGWRGTAARIVEQGVNTMRVEYGSQPQDLIAAVGPSIGPCCYSVGDEVQAEFQSNFPYANELFRTVNHPESSTKKIHLDLWKANQRQLLDAGLNETQITVVGECTSCSRDTHGSVRYFSHRAEHGNAGRMLNVIGIAN